MNIAICDDEKEICLEVERTCNKYMQMRNTKGRIKSFQNGWEFLKEKENFDVAILDVEMPVISGIEVKNQLDMDKIFVIFLSGYEEYVKAAIGIKTAAYLTKPLYEEKLFNYLEEIEEIINREKLKNEDVENIIEFDAIFGGKTIKFKMNKGDLVAIYAENHFSELKTRQGETYLTKQTIKQWRELLESKYYVQCHRGCIINLAAVQQIGNRIIMENGECISYARRRKKELCEKYLLYVNENASLI